MYLFPFRALVFAIFFRAIAASLVLRISVRRNLVRLSRQPVLQCALVWRNFYHSYRGADFVRAIAAKAASYDAFASFLTAHRFVSGCEFCLSHIG